jgi:hypothetical protein
MQIKPLKTNILLLKAWFAVIDLRHGANRTHKTIEQVNFQHFKLLPRTMI